MPSTPVAIALGSNLGNREKTIHEGLSRLERALSNIQLSPFIETVPSGVAKQPLFLNAALIGMTEVAAPVLLETLLKIEHTCGRKRPYSGAPRTLDLDLILYGQLIISESKLTVPHPRFRERFFVLEPLAAIAPDWIDPVTGLTINELRLKLASSF